MRRFIFAERSGIAEEMLDTMGQLFGRLRGGLAYAVIVVGALLGDEVVTAGGVLGRVSSIADDHLKLEIAPGGGTETNFTAPEEPGEYEIVCSTPGHVQAGMLGTLNVVEAE